MEKISIIAITKNGIKTSLKLKEIFPNWQVYAPSKFSDDNTKINWFLESTTEKIEQLFKNNEAIICLFSLGAVIRLISPHLKDKKTDPAVIVIDDQSNFVISALSGHIGGANKLTEDIAKEIGALPVITTAADVNKTIAVDLVGKEFGWSIDDDSNVTKISAFMVNEEKIALYQDTGERDWWKRELPKNITVCSSLEELEKSNAKGFLIISDKKVKKELFEKSVVYRPKTLVVGVGLHWDTSKETIKEGLEFCLEKYNLSKKSIARFTSIKKKEDVQGLKDIASEMNVPLVYVPKEELANITIPNPSSVVNTFEGTPSVSEASAIKVSEGELVVEKQKFPPNLTIAIARIEK